MVSIADNPLWPERLIHELEAHDQRAVAVARGLGADELNWQPATDVWSVGQCLQHLCVTTEVYLPALAAALKGRPRSPVREITPGWFGRWFIRTYVEPSPQGRRARAPRKIAPGERIEPSILDAFLRSNEAARALIGRGASCDVNRVRYRDPLVPLVRFTVGTGLEILSIHQRRHLLQAERVAASR
jgi:hypothetical protein